MTMYRIEVEDLNVYFGEDHILKDVNLKIPKNTVTALIGPSGCGKSTFIRTLNRMNDVIPGFRHEGHVYLDGKDIYDPDVDVVELRKKVGMVFQSRIHSQSLYLRMLLMVFVFMASLIRM